MPYAHTQMLAVRVTDDRLSGRQVQYRRLAFTLVELITVCCCISVLIAMSIPAIVRVRGLSDRLHCQNNMVSLSRAIHLYHTDYAKMPPRRAISPFNFPQDFLAPLSWRVHLMPYLEQSALWESAVRACQSQRLSYMPPHDGYHQVFRVIQCPSDSRLTEPINVEGIETAFTSYLGVLGDGLNQGMFSKKSNGDSISFSEVQDGLSNTLMIGERPPPADFHAGQWYSVYQRGSNPLLSGPDISLTMQQRRFTQDDPCGGTYTFGRGSIFNPCDRFHFWSMHPNGSNFAYGDGSVHFIGYNVAQKVMFSMATSRGGEIDVFGE